MMLVDYYVETYKSANSWKKWLKIEFASEVTINTIFHSVWMYTNTDPTYANTLARLYTVGNFDLFDSP